MLYLLFMFSVLINASVSASDDVSINLNSVSEVDAINCRLDAATYHAFSRAFDDDQEIAAKRKWRKAKTENPFIIEYILPAPILVLGTYSTDRVAFTSDGIMAILDLDNPEIIAAKESIINEVEQNTAIDAAIATELASQPALESAVGFRKFLGERILSDITDPVMPSDTIGFRTIIARSISSISSHPGKTLYGCSYRFKTWPLVPDPVSGEKR